MTHNGDHLDRPVDLRRLLEKHGGHILVASSHGWHPEWDAYRDDPRIIWWVGGRDHVRQQLRHHDNRLPDNVTGVLLSRRLSHAESRLILKNTRRTKALLMAMRSDDEFCRYLATLHSQAPEAPPVETPVSADPEPSTPDLTPNTQETAMSPKKTRPMPKGALKAFIEQHHRPVGLAADEGRRLFALAGREGIRTTLGSVQQAVLVHRRKLGLPAGGTVLTGQEPQEIQLTPKAPAKVNSNGNGSHAPTFLSTSPIPPVTAEARTDVAEDDVLKLIDEAIVGLQLVRERVEQVQRHTMGAASLKARMAALLAEAESVGL